MELVLSATGLAARISSMVDGGDHHLRIVRVRALTKTASGMPWASTTRWRLVPVWRDKLGSCPFLAPWGRHRGGVHRGPVPVHAIGLGQLFLFEKHSSSFLCLASSM
jgi:hypothetical protein